MKGSKCKCGYATNAVKVRCPRCGKQMKEATWDDFGKVLSCARTRVRPEGGTDPADIVLVGISGNGPKVLCWAHDCPEIGDEVVVNERDGLSFACSRRVPRPKS